MFFFSLVSSQRMLSVLIIYRFSAFILHEIDENKKENREWWHVGWNDRSGAEIEKTKTLEIAISITGSGFYSKILRATTSAHVSTRQTTEHVSIPNSNSEDNPVWSKTSFPLTHPQTRSIIKEKKNRIIRIKRNLPLTLIHPILFRSITDTKYRVSYNKNSVIFFFCIKKLLQLIFFLFYCQ